MTTQSDREKAEAAALKSPFCNNINGPTYTQACDAYRDGYLAGAESKDAEWQAKVQGLVDAAASVLMTHTTKGVKADEMIHVVSLEHLARMRKALTQFTAGQPAKGVMVPIADLVQIQKTLESAIRDIEWLSKHESHVGIAIYKIRDAIKSIGKDGGK